MRKRMLQTMLLMLLITSVSFSQQAQHWLTKVDKENPSLYDLQDAFNSYWAGKDVHDPAVTKGKGFKPFKRWEWFMQNRIDRNGYLDAKALWQGQLEKQQQFKLKRAMANSSSWTNLGPQTSIPSGGGAGRINSITFDPTNSSIIWVGAPAGGLWKTTNGGTSWTSNTDNLPALGVSSLAIDPSNTNVMYLGTGDRDAGDAYAVGILKSVDGGASWNTTGLSWDVSLTYRISKVIVHPTNTSIVIAATSNGIYKTTNGGTNWTQTATGNFKDLEIDPSNPATWYAARYGNNTAQVYKSTNTGDSFTQLTSGLPTTGVYRVALAIAPSASSTVYALYCNNTDYGLYGVYKTTNGGTSWTQVKGSSTPNLLGWNTNGGDAGGQGWYDLEIQVSPTNASLLYVGGVNIWKSTNGGTSWTLSAYWAGSSGTSNPPYVHADHHAMEFLPGSGTTLFSGNDGGLFKTTNGGTTWSDLSNGLGIHQYYRLGSSVTNANLILGGAQDNGTDRYNGTSWSRIIGGDGMECAVNPTNANIQYGALYYGDIYRTTSGGTPSNMADPSEDGAWVTPYVLNPLTPTTMYYGTMTRVYRSTNVTNSTPTWSAISGVLGSSSDPLTVLAVAPSNGTTLFAANAASSWKGTYGGSSWTFAATSGLPGGLTYAAFHPTDANTIYVTVGGFTAGSKVYKTTNGGTNWTNVSGTLPNVPALCVAINPSQTGHIYVGTDVGVFLSKDGGATWEAFDTGLPNVIVNELEIHTSSGKIRAATYGRGMWESPLEPAAPPVNSVTVTAPNGGENLTAGTNTSITWTSTGTITNVMLEYSSNGGSSWTTITASTANDGSESWSVPTTTTTQGRIRVSDASAATTNDISNANFSIVTAPVNSVTVTAPNGGENFTGGSSTNITWTSTGTIANVMLEYSLNGGSSWTTITGSTPNDGSQSWTVPGSATTLGRVRVSDASNSATNDMSNANFTITTGTPPITAESESNNTSGTADGPVGTGVSVSGSITTNADQDYFYFDVTTAGNINVTLNIATSADLDIFVYNSALTEVGRGYTTSNPEVVNVSASVGRYYVMVDGYRSAKSAYTLTVTGGLAQITRGMDKIDFAPEELTLYQNHPNPFNPTTTIGYGLPEEAYVSLKIYNVMGQHVRTLVTGQRKAGNYQEIWDGKNDRGLTVSSGIYIYRLQAGRTLISKKMLFQK